MIDWSLQQQNQHHTKRDVGGGGGLACGAVGYGEVLNRPKNQKRPLSYTEEPI